ncbi:hypothetical protein ABW21_db0209721 [Orbilia brochopaga]|nr:hypothetical protein ABW21_db0209721 [Drechslerella brochopaga]
MVLVKTPVEFVDRSLLLLQAHPNTARITTTYHISPPPSKPSKPRPTTSSSKTSKSTDDDNKDKPRTPRGTVTLKTYDPISGALIKFRTDKISDVGRLVAGLHRLGRSMANLKDIPPDTTSTLPNPTTTAADAEGDAGNSSAGGSKAKKKNKKKR